MHFLARSLSETLLQAVADAHQRPCSMLSMQGLKGTAALRQMHGGHLT